MRSTVIPALIEVGRHADWLISKHASDGPGENRNECVYEDEPYSQRILFELSGQFSLDQSLLCTFLTPRGWR